MTSALDDAVGEILGALSENGLDEQTLVILLNDNGGPIYPGVQSNGPNRAMRMGNWKLVQSYQDVWVFDLESDLGEEQNLIKTHPEIVDKMQRELDQWLVPNERDFVPQGFQPLAGWSLPSSAPPVTKNTNLRP